MKKKQWITKSDILNFLTCPFAFKKAREEGFDFSKLFISPFVLGLMKKGVEHEERIKDSFSWKKIKFDISDEKSVMQDIVVSGLSIVNEKLGIIGNPDLIRTAKGELIPIEIKAHMMENETDPYEIAFYWLLLEPYRKRGKEPKGYYILREDYSITEDITDLFIPSSVDFTYIQKVLDTLEQIKNLQDYEPIRNPSCRDCSLFKKVCFDVLKKNWCVSLLTAGVKTVGRLKEANLDIKKIAEMKPEEIQNIKGIGTKKAIQFRHRAKSFIEKKPIFFGNDELLEGEQFIFVDTEFYQHNSIFRPVGYLRLFVIAVGVYNKGKVDTHILYRADCTKKFARIIKKFPNAPIITWGGTTADLPVLKEEIEFDVDMIDYRRSIKKDLNIQSKTFQDLKNRHFDLLRFVQSNVSFPLVSNSIKDISEYLGYNRKEKDMWGVDAFLIDLELIRIDEEMAKHKNYLDRWGVKGRPEKIKKAKERIKILEKERKPWLEKLFRYCKDDVLSLLFVFECLRKKQRPKRKQKTK